MLTLGNEIKYHNILIKILDINIVGMAVVASQNIQSMKFVLNNHR